MRYVEAGGPLVSRIGLGTWQFGSREWGYGESYASQVAPALLRRAIELGITLIDTAELVRFRYEDGAQGRLMRPEVLAAARTRSRGHPR